MIKQSIVGTQRLSDASFSWNHIIWKPRFPQRKVFYNCLVATFWCWVQSRAEVEVLGAVLCLLKDHIHTEAKSTSWEWRAPLWLTGVCSSTHFDMFSSIWGHSQQRQLCFLNFLLYFSFKYISNVKTVQKGIILEHVQPFCQMGRRRNVKSI